MNKERQSTEAVKFYFDKRKIVYDRFLPDQ